MPKQVIYEITPNFINGKVWLVKLFCLKKYEKYIYFLQTEKLDEAHLAIDEIRCNFIFDLFRHDISLEKKGTRAINFLTSD